MDAVKLTLEDEEFTRAFRQYVELSSKTLAQSVNDKAKDLCFAAAREIASGDPAREHPKGAKIYHILAAGGNSRKNGQSLETRFGKAVKGKGNKKLADKIYNRRIRSRGYSRAICVKMAGDLGARLTIKAGKIKHASGVKARWHQIKPAAFLNVKGLEKSHVEDVIQPAFERALRRVANDMQKYINKKLREAARKHSGRKR